MTSEPGEQPGPGLSENQNPGGIPGASTTKPRRRSLARTTPARSAAVLAWLWRARQRLGIWAAVGQEVVGIGNAGGAGGTPSFAGGTVTATGQSITASDDLTGTSERLTGMIATNASIQAGDSGGPLVNGSGQVIGMDAGPQTSGFASQQATGGFAVSISDATHVAAQVLGSQQATGVHVGPTAFLGVQIAQGTPGGPGEGYGSGDGTAPAPGSGVQIAGVVRGSPAAQAGLTAGDVITSVDGHPATSQTTLQNIMVTDATPGQSVTVSYPSASRQQHTVTLLLASGPPA